MALNRSPAVAPAHDFEDVRGYVLDDADEQELLLRQIECTFSWSRRDGHPFGVVMNYVFLDGRFWLTASRMRKRVSAVQRDPRVCIAISSRGSGIAARRSISYARSCTVHDDAETLHWFYPRFAAAMRPDDPDRAAEFVRLLDSPNRVVFEVVPERRVGYDGAKMWAAAPSAAPA